MTDRRDSARTVMLWTALAVGVLVWALRDLALLVGYSVLLAYALHPVVAALQRVRLRGGRPVPRGLAAGLLMLALVAVAGWLLGLAVPRLAAETARFAAGAPEAASRLIQTARTYAAAQGLSSYLDPALEGLRANARGLLENAGGILASGMGRLFGGLGQVLGLVLVPLLAFYLLAEVEEVQASALRFVPVPARALMVRLGGAVDRALRSYVRGQATVCLVMGAAVGIALALLRFPLALLLGVMVGLAELIPYLGFAVAALAIALAGLGAGSVHAMIGIGTYAAINWVIGTFVTPRVMSQYLKMHPFVVTVSVLAGAKLLGPAGALLALPIAAVAQAIIAELAPAPAPGPRIDPEGTRAEPGPAE